MNKFIMSPSPKLLKTSEALILKTRIIKDLSTLKQEKGTALGAAAAGPEVLTTKLIVVDEDAD